jgi:prepilin-type N-terminal cleavage/methylation domain-containing protein
MLSILKNQKGDTIVEVLIAIVVVSMVLVAGYITTTRSVDGMQDTQEHSEALQLAQAQLEDLQNSTNLSLLVSGDCFNTSGNITSGVNCSVDSSGSPTTGQPQFKVTITQPALTTYSVAITWPSLAEAGVTNNVTLFYQP